MGRMSLAGLIMGVAALGAILAAGDQACAAATNDPDRVTRIAGLDVAVWLPTGTPGPRPLVLFSHGVRGCKTQSTYLMRALAQHGILVVAPDHRDKGAGCPAELPDFRTLPQDLLAPQTWNADKYADRRDDLRNLRAALPGDSALSGWSIDPARVAAVGHSLGGYTVLGLAGAWPSWKTDGIVAVVALAPYAEPFLAGGELASVAGPVLFQVGENDFLIRMQEMDRVFAATAAPACKVVYQGADHFAWTDLRTEFQATTAAATIAFLDEAFAGRPLTEATKAILKSSQTTEPECKLVSR